MSIEIWKCIIVWAIVIFLVVRLWNVERNCEILCDAIFQYRVHCNMIATIPMVDYDVVSHWTILCNIFRIWDWGYEHYLTPYDYRLIKPYIKDKRKEKKK